MKAHHVRPTSLHVFRWIAALALALLSLIGAPGSALAASTGRVAIAEFAAVGKPATTSAITVASKDAGVVAHSGDGSIFQALVNKPVNPFAGFQTVPDSMIGAYRSTTGDVLLKGSYTPAWAKDATMAVESKVAQSSLAAAAIKLGKLLPVLGTGVALYEMWKEYGITAEKQSDGSVRYSKKEPGGQTLDFSSLAQYSGPCSSAYPDKGGCRLRTQSHGQLETTYCGGWQTGAGTCGEMGAGGVMGSYVYAALWIPYAAGPEVDKLLTEAEAEAEAASRSTSKGPAVATAALVSGLPLSLSDPKVSGPSSIAGPSKTTTKSDGSTSTQSTKFDCTYVSDQYTCTQTDTTVDKTTDNGTDTTKTSTTTTDPVPQDDLCMLHPDILACQKLGDAPDAGKLSNTQKAVEVVAATFAGSEQCPAAIQFTAFAKPYTISYQPLCDRLAQIKALVLAIAAVLAAYILADSFKVT